MAQPFPEIAADSSFPRPGAATLPVNATAWPLTRERTLALTVVGLFVIAAAFRCYGLNYGGFSEDEVGKVSAVRAYAHGDLSANAEHPVLMKAAMLVSSAGAEAWNSVATRIGWATMAPETALRLPNALAGALAVVPLFLLVSSFFGPTTALWASLLFALDVNVTGINRIGKEDTFLVLFLLLGAWCYERARELHLRDGVVPHSWYAAAGAAFGLMLASKYMPYYLGLWALFGVAASWKRNREVAGVGAAFIAAPSASGVTQRASRWFYLAMVGAFLAANPAILFPSTWVYMLGYVQGHTITHHGAFFAGRLYPNTITATPWGLPWHFYFTYLATKTPLPVLAAIALGLVELVRRRHERGAVFVRVFLVFFLLPASLAAGKFARYLLPALVVLDIVAALGVVRALDLVFEWCRPAQLRALAAGVVVATVVGAPLIAQAASAPHPSLFQNSIGRTLGAPGSMFPNDEIYDIGVREAVTWIARRAAPGAALVSDAPGVVAEYTRRAGRPDLRVRSLSMGGVGGPPVETWVLAQDSHSCYESIQVVEQLRRRQAPDYVYWVAGATAVEAFRMPW